MSNNMKKISRFFSKQWETFGVDGGVEKMSKLYGECQKKCQGKIER
jgi:hypothetical protein